MSNGKEVEKPPRRLVVCLYDPSELDWFSMINDNQNEQPQVVHQHDFPQFFRPSILDRLLVCLSLRKEDKSDIDQAVASAHRFVRSSYRPGDQVVLVASCDSKSNGILKATEILAQHLHYGTRPGQSVQMQLYDADEGMSHCIPIYGVAVLWRDNEVTSVCLANDEVKSRFPSGVPHIVFVGKVDHRSRSCNTTYDPDGSVVTREICDYDRYMDMQDVFAFTTRNIIYWKPEKTPNWDKCSPVWERPWNPTNESIVASTSTSVSPIGMCRYELKYVAIPYSEWGSAGHLLIWKSSRC